MLWLFSSFYWLYGSYINCGIVFLDLSGIKLISLYLSLSLYLYIISNTYICMWHVITFKPIKNRETNLINEYAFSNFDWIKLCHIISNWNINLWEEPNALTDLNRLCDINITCVDSQVCFGVDQNLRAIVLACFEVHKF